MKKHIIVILVSLFILTLAGGHSSAETLTIPEQTTEIQAYAFYEDVSVQEVVLPEGLLTIGEKAFARTKITQILLPKSIQYFAPDAFEGCPEEFRILVYPDSRAQQLCEEYGLSSKIITGRIGISMPTESLYRWNLDGKRLEKLLTDAGYTVDLSYANNSPENQAADISAMIEGGAEVLIVAPVDPYALAHTINELSAQGCDFTVFSYDRLLTLPSAVPYYITFDNYQIGALQGTYIRDALDLDNAEGPFFLEITTGDSFDTNARNFYESAMDVLNPYIASGKLVVKSGQTEFDDVSTAGWSTENAMNRARQILEDYYSDGSAVDAWLCSNDSTALGVTQALEDSYGGNWPVITGQDCDIPNVRNILSGKQSMSVFKDTSILAAQTAKMVIQQLSGETVETNYEWYLDDGSAPIPSYLCMPVCVDASNYREILIGSGIYSEDMFE